VKCFMCMVSSYWCFYTADWLKKMTVIWTLFENPSISGHSEKWKYLAPLVET
jgi:hypothetical protein